MVPPAGMVDYEAWYAGRALAPYGHPGDPVSMRRRRPYAAWIEQRQAWAAARGVDEDDVDLVGAAPWDPTAISPKAKSGGSIVVRPVWAEAENVPGCVDYFIEQWTVQPDGRITNNSGGCITVIGGPDPGTWLSTRICTGSPEQGWSQIP